MTEKSQVTRYQADRTNQKFYFCRLACQKASKTADKQLYQAHCETAIFHLQGAYFAYLQELAHFYHFKIDAPTIEYIEYELDKKTQISPELQRLKQSLADGTLAKIASAYQHCLFTPMSKAMPISNSDQLLNNGQLSNDNQSSNNDRLSNIVTLSNQWLPDEQTIGRWRNEFMALIDELREGMAEY